MRSEVINTSSGYSTVTIRVLASLLFLIFCPQLQAQTSREYSIKAVFLYNFTQFVDWPPAVFSNAEAPFVIGILGADPFRSSLEEAVSGEKVKSRSIVVQRFQNVRDVKNCQILYISNSESQKLREVLGDLSNKNILTVSDIPEFATTGGIIRFMTKENKIKLQINLAASKVADLNISSKLLQVAEIIR